MSSPRLPIPRQRGGGVVVALFVLVVIGLISTVAIQLIRQAPYQGVSDQAGSMGRVEMNELQRRMEHDQRAAAALLADSIPEQEEWLSPIPRITAADTMDLDSLGLRP